MGKKFKIQTVADNKEDRALQEVKKLCKDKGNDYVVKLLGGNKEYTEKILSGEKRISESHYLLISDATGCTYDYLIGRDNARNDDERKRILDDARNTLKKYEKPKDKYGLNNKQNMKPEHSHSGTRAQIIMKEIADEKDVLYIKEKLGLSSEKSVTNMINGNVAISKKHFPVLAEIGNCTVAFLNGTSDVRNNQELEDKIKQYEKIKQQLEEQISKLYDEKEKLSAGKDNLKYVRLLKDNALDGLNQLSLNLESSINEIDTDIIIGNKYADIVSSMISDVNLWLTLINETDRLITTKTNLDRLTNFENEHNRNINIGYIYPTSITPEEIASKVISKAFLKHFFEYVKVKEKEFDLQEIDLEVEEHKKTMELLKYRKTDNKT